MRLLLTIFWRISTTIVYGATISLSRFEGKLFIPMLTNLSDFLMNYDFRPEVVEFTRPGTELSMQLFASMARRETRTYYDKIISK